MNKLHIITIHGIGGTSYPHYLLKNELKEQGYNCDVFSYPSCSINITEASNLLDEFIEEKVSTTNKVILVGHSAGGRVALLSKHQQVIGIVAVASPIMGCYLARKMYFMKMYFGEMLNEIAKPHGDDIRVPLAVITTSYFNNFDGKIWTDEMKHPKSCYDKHIDNSYHSGLQMMDGRMINEISNAIKYLGEILD